MINDGLSVTEEIIEVGLVERVAQAMHHADFSAEERWQWISAEWRFRYFRMARAAVAVMPVTAASQQLATNTRDDDTDGLSVTKEMVEAFGKAWEETPAGKPGDRRRAGIAAVLTVARLSGARPCPHGDATCPCQDGDSCHYEDDIQSDTKAWPCSHCTDGGAQ